MIRVEGTSLRGCKQYPDNSAAEVVHFRNCRMKIFIKRGYIVSAFSKNWEDLTISDNFIFCKVMQNKDICKEMLEVLLNVKIQDIEYLSTEVALENYYDTRGIRMDVLLKDSDKIFNIEMQTGNYSDIVLRSRYYLSSSDVATTKHRTKFSDLRETFIIFICKEDPFGLGLAKYTKETKFAETDKILYNDKTHNVFYNCSAWEKESDIEIKNVLRFIYELKAETPLAKRIEAAADYAKINADYRKDYMYFRDILEEEKELARTEGRELGLAEGRMQGLSEGRAEGHEQGLSEGRAEGRKQGLSEGRAEGHEQGKKIGQQEGILMTQKEIVKRMKDNSVPLQEIALYTNLSVSEINKILKEC